MRAIAKPMIASLVGLKGIGANGATLLVYQIVYRKLAPLEDR